MYPRYIIPGGGKTTLMVITLGKTPCRRSGYTVNGEYVVYINKKLFCRCLHLTGKFIRSQQQGKRVSSSVSTYGTTLP